MKVLGLTTLSRLLEVSKKNCRPQVNISTQIPNSYLDFHPSRAELAVLFIRQIANSYFDFIFLVSYTESNKKRAKIGCYENDIVKSPPFF